MQMNPEVAYGLTPRQLDAVVSGYKERQRMEWAQTLRITQCLGDEAKLSDIFGGEGKSNNRTTKEKFLLLKQRFSKEIDAIQRTGSTD